MADTRISAMTAATTLAAADLIPVVQGGANKKAAASLVLNAVTSRTAVADVDKTVAATDSYIAYSSISAARVVTLPSASAVPAGWELVVMDESGSASATNTITVTRAGADTIDGGTTKVINLAYGGVRLFSDGTSKWSFTATGALLAANNLSDVTAATARTNLGLGTAATQSTGTFCQVANNLSDVTAATARTNLGLGTIATQAASAVAVTGGSIDGTAIGATTPSTVKATSLTATLATNQAVVALTDAASIATDASLGNIFKVTLGGNRTMANPTNATAGQLIVYRIKQDATGSRTITWDTQFRGCATLALPILSTTANKTDYVVFRYNSDDTKWDLMGYQLGY